ncbi:hypothetical protein E3P99_02509 [Wallemia hederae]|uniref:Small RNA 2'-O-methyltransferase n=1 Tax=Wallemia hederae TaxID=1540922 RepID=A0A4T0FK43_9BASI|nr:hypothetical protein E3P99_02509 [Wallemia hederae]
MNSSTTNPFQVPLSTQRYVEVYNILHRNGVEKVRMRHLHSSPLISHSQLLDLGSGNGSLLQQQLLKSPRSLDEDILRLTQYNAIDVDMDQIRLLSHSLDAYTKQTHEIRWNTHNLDLNIYADDFVKCYHPLFANLDAIVAVEVIEHLLDNTLAKMLHTILSIYQPRLFIATTPNYDFNKRFTNPKRVLDPTGRSERLFRHYDHKWEYTVSEFENWCNKVAEEHHYHVEVYGLGEYTSQLLNPSDPTKDDRYPSQVAIFTRVRERLNIACNLPPPLIYSWYSLKGAREHLHDKNGESIPHQDILKHLYHTLDLPFGRTRVVSASAYSVWDRHMQVSCQGMLQTLYEAITSSAKYGGEVASVHDIDSHLDDDDEQWYLLTNESDPHTPNIAYRQSMEAVRSVGYVEDDVDDDDVQAEEEAHDREMDERERRHLADRAELEGIDKGELPLPWDRKENVGDESGESGESGGSGGSGKKDENEDGNLERGDHHSKQTTEHEEDMQKAEKNDNNTTAVNTTTSAKNGPEDTTNDTPASTVIPFLYHPDDNELAELEAWTVDSTASDERHYDSGSSWGDGDGDGDNDSDAS